MTLVHFYKDQRGWLCGFSSAGHSGFAVEGTDIVCAGISALLLTGVNALESIAHIRPVFIVGDGFLNVRIPNDIPFRRRKKARIILETVHQGLLDIEKTYPGYLRVS